MTERQDKPDSLPEDEFLASTRPHELPEELDMDTAEQLFQATEEIIRAEEDTPIIAPKKTRPSVDLETINWITEDLYGEINSETNGQTTQIVIMLSQDAFDDLARIRSQGLPISAGTRHCLGPIVKDLAEQRCQGPIQDTAGFVQAATHIFNLVTITEEGKRLQESAERVRLRQIMKERYPLIASRINHY